MADIEENIKALLIWLQKHPSFNKREKNVFSLFLNKLLGCEEKARPESRLHFLWHQLLPAPSLEIRRPQWLLSIVMATVLLVLFWFVHSISAWLFPLPVDISGFFNLSALRSKLFESGFIPYTILWTFLFGLIYLWQIWHTKVVPMLYSNKLLALVSHEPDQSQRQNFEALIIAENIGHVGKRLKQLYGRYGKDADLSAVTKLRDDFLEIDEENFAIAFTTITWCEVALPLLGFIGTVVGIGISMVGIGDAVQQIIGGIPLQEAAQSINVSLYGLGIAFDTTFLGLAGLFIIALLSYVFKKIMALQLANMREILTDVIAKWEQDNMVVASLETGMIPLLDLIDDDIRYSDEHSSEFRENVLAKVKHVIRTVNRFGDIKRALFYPVVEFAEIGERLAHNQQFVSDKLRHDGWRFKQLSSPLFSLGGVVTVRITSNLQNGQVIYIPDENGNLVPADADTSDRLLLFQLDGEQLIKPEEDTQKHFILLLPSTDLQKMLALSESGDLVLLTIDTKNETYKEKNIFKQMDIMDDQVLPLTVNKKELALVIRRQAQFFNVDLIEFGSENPPLTLEQLPVGIHWSIWATHAPSARLIAAGKTGEQWQLWVWLVFLQRNRSKKGKNEKPSYHLRTPKQIYLATIPKQIVALSKAEFLILDNNGDLHYWKSSRPSPIKLSHDDWQSADKIILGADGWVAVAAGGRLTIWQISRGQVYPYDSNQQGFAIDNIRLNTFRATSDGRYIHAIDDKTIYTWEFPRYFVDE